MAAKPNRTKSATAAALDFPESELVIGLVGPVGSDFRLVENELVRILQTFGYTTESLRLSSYLSELEFLTTRLKTESEADRIASHMTAGNEARVRTRRQDFLALCAIVDILTRRPKEHEARPKTAYVLRSLKTPQEVQALRRIYGPAFVLLGVFDSEANRIRALTKRGMTHDKAVALIKRDREEADESGQQMEATFHLSDAFVSLEDPSAARMQLDRLIELLFGHPFHTPSPDEYGMSLAYTSAMRSADLSRQVGAVIVSARGDVVSTGCNEVPKSNGGLYWCDSSPDVRDFRKGFDSNAQIRERIGTDLIGRVVQAVAPEMSDDERARTTADLLDAERDLFKKSPVWDITEFGRPVHAEMEALLSAGRSGTSPAGGTLYSTTFPCHNCAKHIVAAGIGRVVYVEPYAKSRAIELHADSVTLTGEAGKVHFEAFAGIGPRKYVDLFSMSLGSGVPKRRKKGVEVAAWNPATARVRIPMLPSSYLEREVVASGLFIDGLDAARKPR